MLTKAGKRIETGTEAAGGFQAQRCGSGSGRICLHYREVDAGPGSIQPVLGEADGHCKKEEAVTLASCAKRCTGENKERVHPRRLPGSLTVDWKRRCRRESFDPSVRLVWIDRERGLERPPETLGRRNVCRAQNRSKDRPLEGVRA